MHLANYDKPNRIHITRNTVMSILNHPLHIDYLVSLSVVVTSGHT